MRLKSKIRRVKKRSRILENVDSYWRGAAIIFQTTFSGDIVHANLAGLGYLGCDKISETYTRSVYDYVEEDGHAVVEALLSLRNFAQPAWRSGVRLKGLDNEITVRYYRQDKIGNGMLIFDATSVSGDVIKAQEEQKWAERLQLMLFGLNHELKTPLATIRGYIDILEMSGIPEGSVAYVGAISSALEKMSGVLNDMTAPMRELATESGDNLDLGHTIQSYIKTLPYIAPTKGFGGHFEEHLELSQGVMVSISRSRMYQILNNLFDNSIRALKDVEGSEARITLLTHPCSKNHHADCVVLSFTDNGCGMSENTSRKMFAPYFTTRGSDTGSGLGSYFVYHFVREAGGSIDVESALGEGTTLHLHFPVRGSHV